MKPAVSMNRRAYLFFNRLNFLASAQPHKSVEACDHCHHTCGYNVFINRRRAATQHEIDPSLLDTKIRNHLEAENNYQSALMAGTKELQQHLFAEMKGRIKEDDSSVPVKDGAYAYGISYVTGGQHPQYFRTPRDGGERTILIDGDKEAAALSYFSLGGLDYSPDHQSLAWSADTKGSEFYDIRSWLMMMTVYG